MVVFAVWSRPWLRNLRALPRLGGAWLGLSYWVFGVLGALLVLRPGHLTVAALRLAYPACSPSRCSRSSRHREGPPQGSQRRHGRGHPDRHRRAAVFGAGSLFDALHAIPDSASAR